MYSTRRLAGDADDPSEVNVALVRAPNTPYTGPVNTAAWGSAGDPYPIFEQMVFGRGYFHVIGDAVNFYSEFCRYDAENNDTQCRISKYDPGPEDMPDTAFDLLEYDVVINGVTYTRVGDRVIYYRPEINEQIMLHKIWHPLYGWIIPKQTIRQVIDFHDPEGEHGWLYEHFDLIVSSVLVVAAVYIAAAAIAAEMAASALATAEAVGTAEAIAEAAVLTSEAVETASVALEVAEAGGIVSEISEASALLEAASDMQLMVETMAETLPELVTDASYEAVAETMTDAAYNEMVSQVVDTAVDTSNWLPSDWERYAAQAAKAGASYLLKPDPPKPPIRPIRAGFATGDEKGFNLWWLLPLGLLAVPLSGKRHTRRKGRR